MNATAADLVRDSSMQAGAFPRRAFWLKHLHQWHWVSSAACLVGMLLFAITGIAGLRAHLHARASAGYRRNWLLFGERTAQHDFFFRSEIEAWRDTGVLERLELAFSRDQTARRYVQHVVAAAAAAEIRAWVSAGAAVYVCGSLQGMAAGVTDARRRSARRPRRG
jgi:hypothetical protein